MDGIEYALDPNGIFISMNNGYLTVSSTNETLLDVSPFKIWVIVSMPGYDWYKTFEYEILLHFEVDCQYNVMTVPKD